MKTHGVMGIGGRCNCFAGETEESHLKIADIDY
jgi:hypothetical protein